MEHVTPDTVGAYIAKAPAEVQPLLHALRRTIAEAAPQAAEKIGWGMVAFDLHGSYL